GALTINQLSKMAQALGCTLVYKFVPEKPVDDLLKSRTREKAEKILGRVSAHMAQEDKSVAGKSWEEAVNELTDDFYRTGGRALWEDG
ncbi:MAG: hypothetical protein ACI89D_001266, partial [Bermanella sp.]